MQRIPLAADIAAVALLGTVLYHLLRASLAGAPFIPTWGGHIRRLVAIAGIGPGRTVYELGCGDGRFSIAASKAGATQAVGYDISALWVALARLRARLAGASCRFEVRDIRNCNPSDADVVYLYLMPAITNELAAGPLQRLKPGSRVLSSSFPIDTEKYPFRLLRTERIGWTTIAYLYERI